MQPTPFSSRSAGVLFWGAGYLVAAIAWGLVLAALWPQGQACTTTCAARIEAGAIAIGLLALGGLVGLAIALWLGTTRRASVPRLLLAILATVVLASLVTGIALVLSAPANGDSEGLQTVRSAWSWAFAVPASALLVAAAAARLRLWLRARAARPAVSARPRRA
jgi:ABC-type spermidine/putrescine transport system permease subunit II